EVTKTLPLGEDPLDAGTKLILERGWAEEVSFTDSGARVRGSIEAMPGADMETCHRLRGLQSKLLEAKTKQRVRPLELEFISPGPRPCRTAPSPFAVGRRDPRDPRGRPTGHARARRRAGTRGFRDRHRDFSLRESRRTRSRLIAPERVNDLTAFGARGPVV